MKMDGSVLEEKSSFKMLWLIFPSKLDWGSSYIISIAKTVSKKIEALIYSMKALFLRLLCISMSLPYAHVWNIVVMSGLVLVVATCNCSRQATNMNMQDCWSFPCCFLLTHGSLLKCGQLKSFL